MWYVLYVDVFKSVIAALCDVAKPGEDQNGGNRIVAELFEGVAEPTGTARNTPICHRYFVAGKCGALKSLVLPCLCKVASSTQCQSQVPHALVSSWIKSWDCLVVFCVHVFELIFLLFPVRIALHLMTSQASTIIVSN